MDKETIIGIKNTCFQCNVSFIETALSTNEIGIKSNSYVCVKCGYTMLKEVIRVNSKIISELDYKRLWEYDVEASKKEQV